MNNPQLEIEIGLINQEKLRKQMEKQENEIKISNTVINKLNEERIRHLDTIHSLEKEVLYFKKQADKTFDVINIIAKKL